MINEKLVVIDLFSGAGGLTEGFAREEYNIVAHVEKEKWACETLKTRICYHYLESVGDLELYYEYLRRSSGHLSIDNDRQIIFDKYPKLKEKIEIEVINKTFGDPLEDLGATPLDEIIEIIQKALEYHKVKKVDVIIGGPPCQAYSLIGRGRMRDAAESDKRNFLFKYYKEIVKRFAPEVFIFENVPGILSAHKGKIFEAIKEEFAEIHYNLSSGPDENDPKKNIIDASRFGVHQSRKRVILLGSKKNIKYPAFENYKEEFDSLTTEDAIGDLPMMEPGDGNDFFCGEYSNLEMGGISEYQQLMRKHSIGVLNHKARKHLDRDLRNYARAIEKAEVGQQLKYCEIPEEDSTHKNKRDFEDRFKVHRWNDIPHTIVAHISKDGHYNIHPKQCRSLTVREAARIQSFPDNYKFEGPRTWQYVQVGNAVPPLMAQAIARAVKIDCFQSPKEKKNFEYTQMSIEEINKND
jgi:DNA (cytosine-5)-methyltransferase 1